MSGVRLRYLALLAAVVAIVVVVAWGLTLPAPPKDEGDHDGLDGVSAKIYHSPTCGCCKLYIAYLREFGLDLDSIEMVDLSSVKGDLGVPDGMASCHTMEIGGYFVEGHVPVAAIQKLLEERPAIDGIALPGMPSGSPGMGGGKTAPFEVQAVTDGSASLFITL